MGKKSEDPSSKEEIAEVKVMEDVPSKEEIEEVNVMQDAPSKEECKETKLKANTKEEVEAAVDEGEIPSRKKSSKKKKKKKGSMKGSGISDETLENSKTSEEINIKGELEEKRENIVEEEKKDIDNVRETQVEAEKPE